jgi:hypothetical protein
MSYNTTVGGLCAQKAELWLENLGLEIAAAAADSGKNTRIMVGQDNKHSKP